ncbi:hypothetical protein SAMN05443634_101171 [Chishuiella changwenlii]|uniref:C1q domain-containing protein n=1 Tax=Chishuiella changwenlii TaxID=1434701 RepID=A0A1M6SXW7_9FLAO|nr:hypothetical protein [Chishuiella changwenlii]GGF08918.1 hypothetical protein GCM10010984_27570 [Chishuiella changwenlii]SHK49582.1 hypothetical protein SAMN05443634_101171 [Chishuiella changwenlii]
MKRLFITLYLVLSTYGLGQVGVNTSTPQATLDVVTPTVTDKVLKLSTVTNNVTNSLSDINYAKGAPLYIDDNGYVYKVYTPAAALGLSGVADGNFTITTAWSTLYTLPFSGSILDFSFYTNFSFGAASRALIAGRVSVGTGTGINIYGHNSSVLPITGLSNNLTAETSINFAAGASLQFRLNGMDLQAKLSESIPSDSFLTIYGSNVTRTQ